LLAAPTHPARWQVMFDELLGRIAGRLGRVEPRRRVRAFVAGLLAELPRKNCWTIAEHGSVASSVTGQCVCVEEAPPTWRAPAR
jgi:hypothetical protein